MYLDAIVEWDMDAKEIDAFKLAAIYEQEYRKQFGEDNDGQSIRRNSVPKRGDPRNSNIFRQCWKMLRETKGLLDPHEYKNFVHANLAVIKAHMGHVEPNCITGDKAWIRYKVWKRVFDRKLSEAGVIPPPPSINTTDPKIIRQIDQTKRFVFEKCGGTPTAEKIKEFIDSGIFRFWVATGKVSQFYVVISPFVAAACDVDEFAEQCSFSSALMREKITNEIQEYFKHENPHEFIDQ